MTALTAQEQWLKAVFSSSCYKIQKRLKWKITRSDTAACSVNCIVLQNMLSGKNALALISPNGVIHCLISGYQAIKYIKPTTTNFCSGVLYEKWNVQVATSEKLPFFFGEWILLTLMMYNSLQLHLTCV